MRPNLVVPIVAGAVLLGGCGGSASDSGGAAAKPARKVVSNAGNPWNEAKLRRLIGLRRERFHPSYRLTAHPECVTTNLLRSTAEVHDYGSSGDAVIANPGRSAGVAVAGMSPRCRRLFRQALTNVR